MGKPTHLKNAYLYKEVYIEWEPCEVKHLSNTWKRNQERKLGDSLSSGERNGINKDIYKIVSGSIGHRLINILLGQTYYVFVCSNINIKAYRRCIVGVVRGIVRCGKSAGKL
jgi:hypothetical protein